MANKPIKPPTGRVERKYLLWVLIIIVFATVIYVVIRQFTPEPADDIHGGPAPEYSAPQAIPQGIPEEGNGEALRELRPDPDDQEPTEPLPPGGQ